MKLHLGLNDRIKVKIKNIDDEELASMIYLYWNVNEKGEYKFKVTEIGSSISHIAKEYSEVYFDKGIYEESLIKINNRGELIDCISKFKGELNNEFDNFIEVSKNTKSLLNDVKILFDKRKEYERHHKEKLRNIYENNLKKQYNSLGRLERNCLFIVTSSKSKEELVSIFTNKGFNWNSLNKLSALGLLWMKRDFDNKIQEFIMHKDLKRRLKNHIAREGIDIYELEINYM